ncbi:MAG: hypothetical protein ACRYG8_32775 [Janthinobacterium lividum]
MAEALEIKFGYPGNSFTYQGTGWSWREDGGIWMVDDESTLIIPRPQQRGDYLLELDFETLIAPGRHDFQRLGISVNGVNLSNQVLRSNTVVHCWVPWSVIGGPMKSIVILTHPDGWKPAELSGGEGDQRVLSLYARTARLTLLTERRWEADHLRPSEDAQFEAIIAQQQSQDGLAVHDLMLNFESLGSNCELGMLQRHHGAEPLGLFRFSYTPLDGLLAALESDFHSASFSDQASLVLNPKTREYELVDRLHGFEWHTWRYDGQADAAALEQQELVRLPYLVRRFYETLEDGEKILVLRDEDGPTDQAKIQRLLAALRRHGEVTLLWVSIIRDGYATGDVEWLGDGLMHGWIDRLTTRDQANNASMLAWGVICQRAHQMWLAEQKLRLLKVK